MMQFVFAVLTHTPVWVFALFAFLVWQGIRALRPRSVPLWRSLMVPVAFIVWGVSGFVLRTQDNPWPLLAWGLAALALLPLGLLTQRPFELDHDNGAILRPGSVVPLVRNVVMFMLQYTVAVSMVVAPDDRLVAALVGRAVSGATAGYFIGSTWMLLRRYWRQRALDPAPDSRDASSTTGAGIATR